MNNQKTVIEQKKRQLFLLVNYIPKRIRIVVSVFIMTAIMLLSTFADPATAGWFFIPILFICAYFLTFISVFEEIDKIEWFTLFVMPVVFTIVFYLFFTLLPARWLSRLPYIVFYAFAFYAILLTSNIFNVGVEKSLQLYRAAFSVNFLFQTLITFLIAQVVFTLKQNFLVNSFVISLAILPLAIQLYWALNPIEELGKQIVQYALVTSVFLFQVVVLFSFIPLRPSIAALSITAVYYSLTGVLYHHIEEKLFKNVIREYIFVLIFVLSIVILTLKW